MLTRRAAIVAALPWALALAPQAAASPRAHAGRHGATDAARALRDLAHRYRESQARLDPVFSATLAGDNRFDDQLPVTIAPAQRLRRFAMYREVRRELGRIDRAVLGEADAVTHDLLAWELGMRLASARFDDHLLPLEHMSGLPTVLANFASGQGEQPLRTVAQHEAYLRRLAGLPAWVDQAIANMREGMRRGIVLPRRIVDLTLPQIRTLADAAVARNPFYAPILHLPDTFTPRERQRLVRGFRETADARIVTSMRRLAEFLATQYRPASRDTAGWGALPDGHAWYRQLVREQTTTDLAPEEIHALGLREVERVRGELARLAPRLGYEGAADGFIRWIRTDARFRGFRSEHDILDAYRALDARVRARLPELFGRLPKAALEVRPEPPLTRDTASDHYSAPASDGSRPGVFWVVIQDPADYPRVGMTALYLHEGQPGHHFHFALQSEMDLPAFRKLGWINAFGEGWALYAETLGHEIGLYDDPVAHAGQLVLELVRSARLVVDTGLHALGWSREQAMDAWMRDTGATKEGAEGNVDRYMAWPAQALGYKIGALKFQELRERARRRLGDRFRLAGFHDTVLGQGCLPLTMLEAEVDRWIARAA